MPSILFKVPPPRLETAPEKPPNLLAFSVHPIHANALKKRGGEGLKTS
jgi:hypothetical protein